jgi:hypothetical protein
VMLISVTGMPRYNALAFLFLAMPLTGILRFLLFKDVHEMVVLVV